MIDDLSNDDKIKYLEQQVLELQKELFQYRSIEQTIVFNLQKSKQSLDVAQHNSARIIEKSIEFAYSLKTSIYELLNNIEQHTSDITIVMDLISDFLEKNAQIFNSPRKENISQEIQKEILKKLL